MRSVKPFWYPGKYFATFHVRPLFASLGQRYDPLCEGKHRPHSHPSLARQAELCLCLSEPAQMEERERMVITSRSVSSLAPTKAMLGVGRPASALSWGLWKHRETPGSVGPDAAASALSWWITCPTAAHFKYMPSFEAAHWTCGCEWGYRSCSQCKIFPPPPAGP